MNSLKEIKAEFVRIYEDMLRAKGLPTIFGRIIATLLLEGRELSHKEIAKLTGYSISSVSRTLDQLIGMGIVRKHKDASLKHFVFQACADFPEMIASGMETILKVYKARRAEMKKLRGKVRSMKSDKNAEITRLLATLENVEKTIEFAERVMQYTIKKLRTP